MKDINNVLDNEYMTEEYLDAEIIADNEDPNDLTRIAHEIATCTEDIELTDVGASYKDLYWSMLHEDYNYLDDDDMYKVVKIIEENYNLWEE